MWTCVVFDVDRFFFFLCMFLVVECSEEYSLVNTTVRFALRFSTDFDWLGDGEGKENERLAQSLVVALRELCSQRNDKAGEHRRAWRENGAREMDRGRCFICCCGCAMLCYAVVCEFFFCMEHWLRLRWFVLFTCSLVFPSKRIDRKGWFLMLIRRQSRKDLISICCLVMRSHQHLFRWQNNAGLFLRTQSILNFWLFERWFISHNTSFWIKIITLLLIIFQILYI